MADLLAPVVMPYAWGSRTAIAELTGRPAPSSGPEAELWMGAHRAAPSQITRGSVTRSLAEIVSAAPAEELGDAVTATFGARLPFLLKVLAAAKPLSLQAHPTAAQAREGFEREEAHGPPIDAPNRSYKDASHKPELICALTPFDALCGFRRIDDTLALFDALGVPALDGALAPLRASRDRAGLAATFRALMTLPSAERGAAVDAAVAACARLEAPRFEAERRWTKRLAALYPGDIGVVSALLLNQVHLEPGQAIYLGAGNLHAYLDGVGVEIMAASDNVLRGGLTVKHVDVPELSRVLDFADGPIVPQQARRGSAALEIGEEIYDTPAAEFRLSRTRLAASGVEREARGPEILLVTEGSVALSAGSEHLALGRGQASFVPARTGRYRLEGEGVVYRASVPLAARA